MDKVVILQLVDFQKTPEAKFEKLMLQDVLGKLPPRDNPLFTHNKIDIFTVQPDNTTVKSVTIRPELESESLFNYVSWDPSGEFFMVDMSVGNTVKGRTYPLIP